MSQPPPSNITTNSVQSNNITQSNENSKFNFVDMTKDVEFKTRNKGDKSLKVNKQFRYNKRFQNNFFIFKTGQQPESANDSNHIIDSNNYYQMPFSNSNLSGNNLTMDESAHMVTPSTSTNPLILVDNHQSNQYRVNGRFAKRNSIHQNNNSNMIPPYITNSETFNLLNSNAQLMLLMGSSYDPQSYHINDPLINLMTTSQSMNNPQDFGHTSYFLEEEEEDGYQNTVDNRFNQPNIDEINPRKTVTRSNSFTISPQDMNTSNTVHRAMSAPTIVFEKASPKQADDEEEDWLEDQRTAKTGNKKRQRKSLLFTSSSSSGVSSSESSVQNSNSNSPSNCELSLMVNDNDQQKKNDFAPQHKKKNIQQEQFELEFLETNQEESRDELDMLLDSIILENNQFN